MQYLFLELKIAALLRFEQVLRHYFYWDFMACESKNFERQTKFVNKITFVYFTSQFVDEGSFCLYFLYFNVEEAPFELEVRFQKRRSRSKFKNEKLS